jgi:pimeloyl-ACP methyl ester carboxylesterase
MMTLGQRLSALLRPYSTLRDQLGSVRGVYLAADRIRRRDDMGAHAELVLLLHGFFQTRNIWEVMEDRLRFDGFGVMSFNLGGLLRKYNTRPIDEIARRTAEKIEALADRHKFDRFHVVGHSKGGLIARRYVQEYGGHRRVKSVVTLGTPHHGTATAWLGVALMGFGALRSSAGDLLPRSNLIRTLGRDSFDPAIPLTSIYSRADLVCPWWCSVLQPRPGETGLSNVHVPAVGHSQLVWDPAVYQVVRERLAAAATAWEERGTAPPIRQRL